MRALALTAFAVASLSLAACQSPEEAAPTAQSSDNAQLEANKQLVLDMWHTVLDGRDIEAASRFIAEDYIQHSPSAANGLDGLVEHFKETFPGATALEPGTYPLTQFEFVLAEGDLVQLMFKREMPSREDPSKTVPVWWYDTYRVENGLIVEHWDSAWE